MLGEMRRIAAPVARKRAAAAQCGAHADGELLDSVTGKRLLAGVTARVGGKKLDGDVLNEWADIEDSLDHWAKEFATHLSELKRGEE